MVLAKQYEMTTPNDLGNPERQPRAPADEDDQVASEVEKEECDGDGDGDGEHDGRRSLLRRKEVLLRRDLRSAGTRVEYLFAVLSDKGSL